MKLAASAALLLAGAGLVACGSSTVDQRTAIVPVVRSWAGQMGDEHVHVRVHISKLDPKYAIAHEEYTRPNGKRSARTWTLDWTGKAWDGGPVADFQKGGCSDAPARVRRELFGTGMCSPRADVFVRIPWGRSSLVRLRYCKFLRDRGFVVGAPGVGGFVAASRGVGCHAAAGVVHALESPPCNSRSRCLVDSFACVEYYTVRHRGPLTFAANHHALCTELLPGIVRRIEWNGG